MERESRNIYKTARTVAGLTQERWAEAVGVSVDSVHNYEAGTQIPSDDIVRAMSEISGLAPLSYWHLCHKSELAADMFPEVEIVSLPQAVCALVSRMQDFVLGNPDALLRMAADGKIDKLEHEDFMRIMADLDGVVQAALQLKYAEGGQ